jgi:hypothetical protein
MEATYSVFGGEDVRPQEMKEPRERWKALKKFSHSQGGHKSHAQELCSAFETKMQAAKDRAASAN